jgi:hypothetical protein
LSFGFVTEISGRLTGPDEAYSLISVKNIAIAENPLFSGAFFPGSGRSANDRVEEGGGPKAPSLKDWGLARMLLPQPVTMKANSFSMMLSGEVVTTPSRGPVAISRGTSLAPSFFCFGFLRDSFHKSVGTHSRPLRGGKEGSVCRAM